MSKIPFNLLYLKYFFDAVKEGSISASAKSNFVSQSAVSQAISKLEESLQCQLLSHKPTRFKVTEKGQQLFEHCKEVFCAIRKAEDQLSSNTTATLTFGCTHSFALALLPDCLKLAKLRMPHLSINLRLGHCHDIKAWIKKGKIDFGILLNNDDLSPFACEMLLEGQYRLYAAKACKKPQALSFLLDSEERQETNWLKTSYEEHFGKPLAVLMEISSWEVIANLTEAGLGVGFFPDYVVHKRGNRLKRVFEQLDPIPYKLHAIFNKKEYRNCHADQFLQLVRQKLAKENTR